MFGTIFNFEIKRWFKSWLFYVYIAIFFLFGFMIMGASIGFFDSVTVTATSLNYMNSPLNITFYLESFANLMYFLFPSIIGAGVYRDYKYNTQHLLYSYPLTKSGYLLGKFLSGFLVVFLMMVFIGIGMYLATLMPFANQTLVGPSSFWNYAQGYLLITLPNMFVFGFIVFVIVTLSRSVYVGFVSVLVLIIIQSVVVSFGQDIDNKAIVALLDPSGLSGLMYYTEYWTIDERNVSALPLGEKLLYNRLIWMGLCLVFIAIMIRFFTFTQQAPSFSLFKRKQGERLVKDNFRGFEQIKLPKVNYSFSLGAQLRNVWSFAKLDLKYLAKNKVFIILTVLGGLMIYLVSLTSMTMYGTNIFPVTRTVLGVPGQSFNLIILVITFLGAGLLVHRGTLSRMNLLVDSTAVPNWVFFVSKYIALIAIQALLLVVVIVAGIIIQVSNGYYKFELDLYIEQLFGLNWVWFIIWAGLALFVQTMFRNYIVGFLVLLVFFLFKDQVRKLGIEQDIFFFNRLPGVPYSDMDGFGSRLGAYWVYAFYWLFFLGFLGGLTLLFWRRELTGNWRERIFYFKERASKGIVIPMLTSLILFLGLGGYLYYQNTIANVYYSAKDVEKQSIEYEKKYKRYEEMLQPRITDIKVAVDLYPESRDFEAKGRFLVKNKTEGVIDTLFVSYRPDLLNEITVDGASFVRKDTVYGVQLFAFTKPLAQAEETVIHFTVKNKPNTVLKNNSPILHNGTFLNNASFPSLGYNTSSEETDDDLRKKYGLGPKERMHAQSDVEARGNTYISSDADWISFETTVSTSPDQIAIAPGYLQKEWAENNRRYFHYKMDQPMLNFYAYNSARYEVARDKWNDINIEVYYHKDHDYNVERMIESTKKSLAYFEKAFSPYQHKQVRIIEFPSAMGSFAQSFANTIPFSEAIGFIANVNEEDEHAVDFPFSVTSHEVAHQWWAHQVIGANVQGATMLSESLSEYSSLKVLEQEYGKGQMQKYLRDALNGYLRGRGSESKKELPLMYNENQQYIHYNKGALVFYTMSDYLGDEKFNGILKEYVKKVAFQDAPYTIAGELVDDIRSNTPDSLKYMVKDMFETITLYDNYVKDVEVKALDSGQYEVKMKVIVSKYRAGEKGERTYDDMGKTLTYKDEADKEIKSLPLADYVEIGIFSEEDKEAKGKKKPSEKVLHLQKYKLTDIVTEFVIIVDEKPLEVGIDPYNKLIDTRSYDNRKKL